MTRDEHRAKCIEAMIDGAKKSGLTAIGTNLGVTYFDIFAAAFDSLPTAGAFVVPIDATKEMVNAVYLYAASEFVGYQEDVIRSLWGPMAASGNLTNPPEEKP